MEILHLENVSKSYDKKIVLENLNCSLKSGEIIGLLGKNGTGKTTLLKMIAGLLTPEAGEILIDGLPIGVETKSIVSFLPERSYFNRDMSIDDCFNMFSDFYQDFDRNKALDLLKKLDVDYSLRLKEMSKGMIEKLQLALAMSRNAKLYILDEPLGGVDPATREYILDTILSSLDNDSTLLISTHLISDIERILDHVIILSDKKIVVDLSADELRQNTNSSIDEYFRREFRC